MKQIKYALGGILFAVLFIALFINAVLQQSYRYYPPTQEELNDNPTLVKYLD